MNVGDLEVMERLLEREGVADFSSEGVRRRFGVLSDLRLEKE